MDDRKTEFNTTLRAAVTAAGQPQQGEQAMSLFAKVRGTTLPEDAPALQQALVESTDSWTRELLADPLATVGGPAVLADLLVAYDQNLNAAYDNDGFSLYLIELAEAFPTQCRDQLNSLRQSDSRIDPETIDWLLEFC